MLPSLETKLIGIIVVLFGLGFGGWYLHHEGYEQAKIEFTKDIAVANLAAKTKLDAINAQVAANQTKLNTAQQAIIDKQKELENAKSDYEYLHAKYVAGTERMSIPTGSRTDPAEQDNHVSAATGASENGSVEILPADAAAILDFAHGYREDVRLKNECIDLYNTAMNAVNGSFQPNGSP